MPSYGSLTVDGALGDWLASDRLDNAFNAQPGIEVYGRRVADTYVFALKQTAAIGAGTTIWLNTDMNRASGYKVFGFAAGAEYAINVDATTATLVRYTAAGVLDATFAPVALDRAASADGKTIEFAIAAASLGGATGPIEAYTLVNNATALPIDYAGVAYTLRAGVAGVNIGGVATLDGSLSEWTTAQRLDTAANAAPGYEVYGRTTADSFVVALKSAVPVGPNTTIWINADQGTTTGYQVFGSPSGAEYAVEFDAAGNPALYSVNAATGALTLVGAVQASFNADRTIVELAFSKVAVGAPHEIDLFADVNNTAFLPDPFAKPQYELVDTAGLPVRTDMTKKVAIVFSETSASKYFSATAYSQLFMNAQSQAANAGVNYDIITEADLKDIAKLVNYDAIVFPGFANVKAADVQAIANTLEIAVEQYHIGLIAAGDFMTSDENGNAIAGNSYARMEALLGVTRETGGTGDVVLRAGDVTHTTMEGYTAGEVIHSYTNIGWSDFRPVTTGVTTVTETIGGVVYDAAIATTTNGGRNVHFASQAVSGDSNLLQNAIEWSVYGSGIRVGLQMSRFNSITASRTDLDSSSFTEDVSPVGQPGIYDKLLPILAQWKADFNFVGSYYINVGDPNVTNGSLPQSTNWQKSLAYYRALLMMGNEVGSHSLTHLTGLTPAEDTNILTTGTGPGSFDYEFRLARDIINQQIGSVVAGYTDTGAAVPGAPESTATALQILQYYEYMSGGWSGVTGGYPGAIGYLTPGEQSKVYIAPNVKFDFTLVEFQHMTLEQAAAEWAREVAELSAHSDTPIIVWPWHDYAASTFVTPGDTNASPYSTALFTAFIAAAYASGAEFVTLEDLAHRVESFDHSSVSFTQTGNVINATVTSADAGKFALDLDGLGTSVIQSVANWYAYDSDSVFTTRNGGTYAITVGGTQTDVTHITSLPMRAELLSVSGDGTNVSFSIIGEGNAVIDLKNPAGLIATVTGATIVSQVGDILTIKINNDPNANLLVNGSFELGTLSTVNNTVQYPTNGALTGWTNSGATSIEVWRNFGGIVATNGNYIVELDNGTGLDGIYQNVTTTAGGLYTLTVDLRARVGNTDTVEIWWAGKKFATVDPVATGWTTYSFNVIGTGGSDRLEFRETSAQNNGLGALIDNVRLTATSGQQHNVSVTLGAAPVNQPPVITSNGGGATAGISIAENLTGITTVTATNPEAGQTVTFSIVGGADAAKFAINATTGVLTFIAAPDYENPTDAGANNVYDVIVAAKDNLDGQDTQAIAVTITNTNGVTVVGGNSSGLTNGTNENDTISGGGGTDIINGLGGPDNLSGGTGLDIIDGGAGNDTINGGSGVDYLTGGAGNDRFVYAFTGDSGTNILTRDIISDFTHGQDIIDLNGIDANTLVTGNQNFTFLATAGAAFTGAGQVRYVYTSILGQQHTIIEINVDGDASPEMTIDLVGRVTLTSTDFVL